MTEHLQEKFRQFSIHFHHLPQFFGSHHLHLFLDGRGKILELSEKWFFSYPSVARVLTEAGHLRDFFDWPEKAPAIGTVISVRNKKDLPREEAPEALYTSFPTFILFLLRFEEDLYFGSLRMTSLLPNIFLQRPNGIVYVDRDERLVGFNETFFRFFKESFKTPGQLLKKPASLFMEPTPTRIQEERRLAVTLPDPSLMRRLFTADFTGSRDSERLSVSEGGKLRQTGEGLDFTNTAPDDFVSLTLPVPLPGARDFLLELDFIPLSGFPPLILVDERNSREAPLQSGEYSIGPDVPGKNYLLKRRGIVQRSSPAQPLHGKTSWRFSRAGQALLFFEGGEQRLFLHDPNPLNQGEASLSIALRTESACRLLSLRLYCAEKPVPPPVLPVTRLKIATANAFVVNPMDNLALSSSHPEIQGYVLENATELQTRVDRLQRENQRIMAASGLLSDSFLGKSAVFMKIKEMAAKAASSDVSVLLQGETGTGKEALAQFLHGESKRKNGPFVKVDCSNLPKELVDSELFGHERGAFTGAAERREGLFEQADGGTLFLDEIGNLSREVQAKLLHFLQDHTFTRVGGRKPISIDVRVITASNVPLGELVQKNEFRPDLYYRMEAVAITLPPLRERPEDIPELCRHFIKAFNAMRERKIRDFSPAAYEKLLSYPWPGNIRELKNTVERAALFSESETIPPESITLGAGEQRLRGGRKGRRPLKGLDADAMRGLFRKHGGVAQRVARELGVSAPALYGKLKKLGLAAEGLRKTE